MSSSPTQLRILIVDDSALDGDLIVRSLRNLPQPFRTHQVSDRPTLLTALESFAPHVILCDFAMPGFGGLEALDVVRRLAPAVPFIFVSGSIGEEVAVAALRAGASDYVLKDRLARLPSAVERALEFARATAERERAQERLRRIYAFETIGHLTGGLAHDFNNLLTVISGSLELVSGALPPGTAAERDVNMARDATMRATNLTRSLLALARGRPRQRTSIAVDQRLEELLPLLRNSVAPLVVVYYAPGAAGEVVRVDSAEFDTAVLNLAINARDAMPNGGALRIATRPVELDTSRQVSDATLLPGRYLTIEVVDEGVGMSPQVLAKAFEPLFTTKTGERGTGLGLPMVRAVCLRSGGSVELESLDNKGTTVRMWLRIEERSVAAASAGGGGARPEVARGAVVLLVDDAQDLRSIMRRCLEQAGYRVDEAGSALEARQALAAGARYDIIVCDIRLPDGDGIALTAEARARFPDIAVLVVSGIDAAPQEMPLAGCEFLHKPFDRAGLLHAVSAALETAERGTNPRDP